MSMKRFLLALLLFASLVAWPADTFLDAESAGPDFALQGEYEGKLEGGAVLAAQVVAEGKGAFAVYFLAGGLPGAGWDGKTRLKTRAATEDGKTVVSANRWTGTLANGLFTGHNPDGVPFTLRRVLRKSPTEGQKPPEGALVLFDGTGLGEWKGGRLVGDHCLGTGATTRKTFRDFKLHVEFRLPFQPDRRGQGRANSGVYLQNRYEVQILDSFGLAGTRSECGALYEQTAPDVNLCLPPLSWQTYDIDFQAARFDGGQKVSPAVVTVLHNGVKVHDRRALRGPTGFGYKEEDTPGPIHLQNHGSPVYFRNIWVVVRP